MLKPWKTLIPTGAELCNLALRFSGSVLRLSFDDLRTEKKFIIVAKEVLGLLVNDQHNSQRLGNTFIQEDSDWISDHLRSPFRTKDIPRCKHYIIDGQDLSVEFLCLQNAEISEHELNSDKVNPKGLSPGTGE